MQSPKQSLVCNLNHVHLQHVSLGLQLSKRPELQEETNTLAPSREQAVCHECEEHGSHLVPNLVDANSNNPSLTCRCCEAHPVSSEVKRGLRTPSSLTNCPTVNHEEEEEEEEEDEASPSDPTSSSISSCSDLSLDESPVSVYCKPFPAEQARSPESQPNIVPLEDTQNVLVHPQERGPNLNAPLGEHPEAHIWDSPDSLYSSSSLDSPSDHCPPCPESLVRSSHVGSTKVPPLVPPPVRPCRAPPAVPVVPPRGPEVDSNCNALPAREVKPNPISLGQVDINSNRATGPVGSRFGGVPPPIPPRTKRGLQGLRRSEGGKPSPELVPPAPVEPSLHHPSEPQGETPKKTITSFHELAQKRKKATVAPPLLQTKKDQSDWLIVFSPETEMPPFHQLSWASRQETAKPPTSSGEPSPPSLQRGVITFKDLRYRKQNSQLATKVGNPGPQRESPAQGVPDGHSGQEWNDSEAAAHGHLWGAKEIPARMKRSRLALQPIVERGCEEGEDAAVKPNPLGRPLETEAQARWGPDACRKAETGDTRVPTAHQVPSRPRGLLVPLPPARGKAARPASPLPHPHRLEKVAELPSDPSAGAFCPRLKTLSCEDVCLLATAQGPIFEAVSPDLPIRLSPIGAYSPPARSLLPFLNSPDLAAQLGDSQLTPEVGHLILHTLCPALHALVGDGLKPFQKDVITGYRPSSPWSVVEASARPELVSSLYLPTAFLLLSQRICPRWAEELLLLLQPLSVLTFQLDLLFEHRHLPISVRPMPQPSTPSPEPGAGRWESPGLTPLDLSEPPIPFATLEDAFLAPSSPLQEWLLPQRLLGWKERLASTLRGNGSPVWAQPGQEESPAQPPSRWKPQWTKLWVAIKESRTAAGESGASAEECPKLGKNDSQVEKRSSVCKEDAPAARSPSQPGMDPPEAGEVYLEGTEEKPEAGNGNERRLGWLFGANSPGAVNETDPNLLRSRRPSRWLCPAINTLAFAKKGGPTQKTWQEAEGAQNPPDPVQTYTAVRALCDHAGEAAGHLAFCKGEILQVMETVDENWLKCLSGGRQGLVHVGYTSLII
ncbi:hypothetical protein Chor_005113 [Crotalus horridus]